MSLDNWYYDLDDKPTDFEGWAKCNTLKREARSPDGESSPADDPTRIGSDHIGDAWVSTVWMGMNHQHGNGPPLIYETMIFGGPHDEWQDRYSTRCRAEAGHARVVAALQAGDEP